MYLTLISGKFPIPLISNYYVIFPDFRRERICKPTLYSFQR